MPSALTYPGVYVEEVPSSVRTIIGVSTSVTAFVDFFAKGPMNQAVMINSLADFDRIFGGLDTRSEASYAIQQFYLNGGQTAWVVRVAAGTPALAHVTLQDSTPADSLVINAANEGLWGDNIQVGADANVLKNSPAGTFNLAVRLVDDGTKPSRVLATEVYRNVVMDPASPNYVVALVNHGSSLIQAKLPGAGPFKPPATATDVTSPSAVSDPKNTGFHSLASGADGAVPDSKALLGDPLAKSGIYALDAIDPFVFNIMCIPVAATLSDQGTAVYAEAQQFCGTKRAFLIVDIPQGTDTPKLANTWLDGIGIIDASNPNSAAYFPRLVIPDPVNGNLPRNVGSSGTMAGVYARTDSTRGVWKAPAGTDASLRGASVAVIINDGDNGALNTRGLNVLRNFPVFGAISWGGRTLVGADQQASQWKYIPVRRTALYIEESLFEGLKWVVFEPNDEPLWAQIRLNAGAFMQNLFRQGAFQGSSPKDAY
ncbi:MAG TPA: phage tail sheath C-terminal domain-containing protein, partial [Blastocatellia bacterium]|nr:phage tail sheath C-terminal domain-containing protein [Blastocatellia bacterium]